MGKSVNDYYAEKMKKLLDMQNNDNDVSRLASPQKKINTPKKRNNNYSAPHNSRADIPANKAQNYEKPQERSSGREYYDRFRSGDTVNKRIWNEPAFSGTNEQKTEKKAKSPEQTYDDILFEEEKREEAEFLARRGKKVRRARDTLISVILIVAVAAVVCFGAYKLIFVISDINVSGNSSYSAEEIIDAAGIEKGANLYSFRNSLTEKRITLLCPGVGTVDIDKVAPSSVNVTVNEEKAFFYANFYGEYTELSENVRVMNKTDKEKAVSDGLIQLKLPSVSYVLAGEKPVFSGVRNDAYIYDIVNCVRESDLFSRIVTIDMRNKYNISLNCEGKYYIILGEAENIDTKLKIISKVLEDSMFRNNDKVKINVSDLSETSVITDNKLVFD